MGISFVAIDFETANASRGSPCAVGLTKVLEGSIVDQFYSLTRPPKEYDYFDPWNISIHGITPSLVKNAKRFGDLWPKLSTFTGDLPLVAHNAGFDMGVIREALTASDITWPSLNYLCTMVLARRIYAIPSFRLPYVAEAAGISWDDEKHHDAKYDSEIAAKVLISMMTKSDFDSIPDLLHHFQIVLGVLSPVSWSGSHHKGSSIPAKEIKINESANPSHPLYGAHVCFTGLLHSMPRYEAWTRLGELGGISSDNVTNATNFLVVGEQDSRKLRPGEIQSSKFQKAAKRKSHGQQIEVITESDFVSLLEPISGGI